MAAPTVESYSGRPSLGWVEDPAKSVRKPPGSRIVTLMPSGLISCGPRWPGHETFSPGTRSATRSGDGLRSTLHSRRSRTAALTDGRGGCQTVAGRIERKRFGAVFLFCDTFAVQ